ncbi:protein MRVI1-like, partial [Arapaima gigas]
DFEGHVIDLVQDELPELQLSEEDKRKNMELLKEAKEASKHFLMRRGRRSACSLPNVPTGGPLHRSLVTSLVTLLREKSCCAESLSEHCLLSAPSALSMVDVPDMNDISPPGHQVMMLCVSELGFLLVPQDQVKPAIPVSVPGGSMEAEVDSHLQPSGEQEHKALLERVGPASRGSSEEKVPESKCTTWEPVTHSSAYRAPCTAEIKTIDAFPPLMRATSWDMAGSSPEDEDEEALPFLSEMAGCRDFPALPTKMLKLAKVREEHKLLRNQNIVQSKLPDLNETAEQDTEPCPSTVEEPREKLDALPNISDLMLRKLKLHRAQMGRVVYWSLTVLCTASLQNAFVQLSLAFRNDSYTLDTRLRQAERERNLAEDNTEQELLEFRSALQATALLWQNPEYRESYHRLLESVAVLQRLATRLSSRAEMVGAMRQERRMNKATEVMMQYVENLKRTYEKDHSELMEFKKLANQNPSRCYAASLETEEGVPRSSRSMSLTMGKTLPRRRVSVAVVPKFNLVSIPGQAAVTTRPVLPVLVHPAPHTTHVSSSLCDDNSVKTHPPMVQPAQDVLPSGKITSERETGAANATKLNPHPVLQEELSPEVKAKIEEEAYKKGYQEGLRYSKELQELKEEEEEQEEEKEEKAKVCKKEELEDRKSSSRVVHLLGTSTRSLSSCRFQKTSALLDAFCPKVLRWSWLLWVILFLLMVIFCVVSVFHYFGEDHSELGDISTRTDVGPDNFFRWNVGLDNRKAKSK